MERSLILEEPKKQQKPFKLCFADKHLLGKSEIRIERPLKLPITVTDKFHTDNSEHEKKCHKVIEKYIDKLKVKGPSEKYPFPLTENQRYGWYQHQFIDVDRSDRRLCFNKQPNILIKEHLMNYAKIRD